MTKRMQSVWRVKSVILTPWTINGIGGMIADVDDGLVPSCWSLILTEFSQEPSLPTDPVG